MRFWLYYTSTSQNASLPHKPSSFFLAKKLARLGNQAIKLLLLEN